MEGDTTTRKVVVRDMAAHPDPVDQTAETQTQSTLSPIRPQTNLTPVIEQSPGSGPSEPRFLTPLAIPSVLLNIDNNPESSDPKPSWFARRGSVIPTALGNMPRSIDSSQTVGSSRKTDAESVRSGQEMDNTAKRQKVDRAKEEMAMAKWRKWIVDQPVQPIHTPIRSNRASPAPQHIPMVPLSPSGSAPSPTQFHRNRLSGSDSPASRQADSRLGTTRLDQNESDVIYNTESVRALRDVELAVDEELLAKAAQRAAAPRRMSTNPRVSEIENPFIDLASRLGSRRVRPSVLELIQALGHYIDVIWSMRYPNILCPWIIHEVATTPGVPYLRLDPIREGWRSRMVTAVQAGKTSGHVDAPPTEWDLRFWESEVRHSIRDVEDVVGICKGVGWAFRQSMMDGQYGEVNQGNVLGDGGSGGNIARLLNDLEEALWGDAPPRYTDLAYELPEDFDPYALPDPDDLMNTTTVAAGPIQSAGLGGSALTEFFAANASPQNTRADAVDLLPLPDLVETPLSEHGSPMIPSPRIGGLERYGIIEEEGLTLEEIGRKRHKEWLERSRSEAW